jgi:simple sugar transport system substrate-binding protein
MDGSWESTDTWEGIKGGMVKMAPYGDAVPEDVRAAADKIKADIVAGTLHPFQGPLNNQAGEEIVAAGEVMSDKDLASMNVYVEGVQGSLPK